ncbi:MAG: hydantoinase/oxoprolinase family protein [Alphaproteobacteria bacterium]|nr:hydantoinase/oxoprolinase family protein [Alphaproteobacteria bacterium]
MYYLGVDTGGTFTDFVLFHRGSGAIATFKVRSTPHDPGAAIAVGLRRLAADHGVPGREIERFIFGTTVATNAVLEKKGAATALITTRGMRDVLEIQRQWRHRLFDLHLKKPSPLVPRRHRLEADERVGADGAVLQALTPEEIDRVVGTLATLPVEAVAVVLLFSFLTPQHEREIAAAISASLPRLHVTISSEVSPEFREYERSATTVMNAYAMPKIHAVADRLEAELGAAGFAGAFSIIQSNGGLMGLARMRTHPINTLLSGPAGGAVGAAGIAKAAGHPNVLTLDVGGTSADIALIEGGTVAVTAEGGIAGYPVRVPQLAVHTIGAGGGSIARVALGLLKVGPQSAGAEPGPVCYGQGGTAPTGTDAALCLGMIDPDYFLGGEIRLDRKGATAAIETAIARPLGMSVDAAALSIMEVLVSTMIAGIRKVSVEAGHDPRDFALLPFGGAGALYAGPIAEEMGLARIFVPRFPSVLSALGMLMTDIKHTRSTTRIAALASIEPGELSALFAGLAHSLERDLADERLEPGAARIAYACDLRYVGQAYEIAVALPDWQPGLPLDMEALTAAFHREHERNYGNAAEDEPVELVNLRATATGPVPKAMLRPLPTGGSTPRPKSERPVLFRARLGWQSTPVYDRDALPPGWTAEGPMMIEEAGASIPVFPGRRLRIDDLGNIVIDVPTA